jgi:hypothetical protein
MAMVWGSDDGDGEVGGGWGAAICAGTRPAEAQANSNIEKTRRNIIQETSAIREYASATDLLASF